MIYLGVLNILSLVTINEVYYIMFLKNQMSTAYVTSHQSTQSMIRSSNSLLKQIVKRYYLILYRCIMIVIFHVVSSHAIYECYSGTN